jgi:hypothetical protein
MHTRTRVVALLIGTLTLCGACGSSSKNNSSAPGGSTSLTFEPASAAQPWPAPSNPMELARKAGLVPEPAEQLKYHVHSHLDVFINGKPIIVPAGIGIDITNPAVKNAPDGTGHMSYGGISPPCDQPCISPLHTHDTSGVVHTESSTHKDNTLGQFFIQWDVKLTSDCVDDYCSPKTPIAIYVDGKKFTGDPNTIPLSDQKEIAIVIGPPPASIPSQFPT